MRNGWEGWIEVGREKRSGSEGYGMDLAGEEAQDAISEALEGIPGA
jgi:hypothetical protein